MKAQHLLFCLSGAIAFAHVAYAEVNFGKQIPSADQVIEALNPAKASPSATPEDADYEGDVKSNKTRSIDMSRLKATPKTTKTKPKKTPIVTPRPESASSAETSEAALSMEIIFGYNSAELTEIAKQQLTPVGQALASGKLSNLSFVVEGHTDAVGSDSYNRLLSEQRAASVKSFLVNSFNVLSAQIQTVGKGKSDLLDPRNPDSEVNRRVRIIARK